MMGFVTLVFFSFIAGLIYSGIIYATVPYKVINLKVAIGYLLGGGVAIAGVLGVHELFPWWLSLGETITKALFDVTWMTDIFYLQVKYFVQVGFLEEFMKIAVFLIYGLIRTQRGDNPVATMFYMMMVSMGFGLVENYRYAIDSFGSQFPHPFQVLAIRSFTATLGHMIFGLISGFWIALGGIPPKSDYSRSWFDVVIKKRPNVRKWFYTGIGLIGAIIFHGIYNFNNATFGAQSLGILYIQLIIGLLAGSWCFQYLNRSYRKYRKKLKKGLKVSNK